jgi:hypothetical protein
MYRLVFDAAAVPVAFAKLPLEVAMPLQLFSSHPVHPKPVRSRLPWLVVAAFATLLAPLPALADAIDGDWCFATQNLHIRGPKIRLPSGAEITGDYDRHGFRYTVPANEQGAGTAISMQLFGEELMQLTRAGGTGQPEMWRRCKPVS